MNRPTSNELRKRLDLFGVRRFEALLCLPMAEIEALANKAGRCYSPFIPPPKRRWFPKKPITTKRRRIDNPNDKLKQVQKRILNRMLESIELPGYVKGGVKGRSLHHNVELHMRAKVLVTIDIKSFFPSITNEQIYSVWRNQLNCSTQISGILTQLTTLRRCLPQGAPTSTYLANLLIASIDDEIVGVCKSLGVVYSTWVDDLAFSGPSARRVIETAVDVLQRAGFAVSHRKLKVMGPSSRKILNGIIVGWKLNVPSEYRRSIRSGIDKIRKGLVRRQNFDSYVKSMNGKIDHVSRFNKKLADRLREEFTIEVVATRKRFNTQ